MTRIIIDWGTTNFRAYRFLADGSLGETRQAAAGILSVEAGRFEDALEQAVGDWLAPGVEVLLSGMITSRNGWVETPYAETPVVLPDLAKSAVSKVSRKGASLKFLPGVAMRAPTPDVMRGEEIQVFGSVGPDETATLVLPGTHSKWVQVENGRIASFRTFFTGEMFSLLLKQSIIGRVASMSEDASDAAFMAGVYMARAAGSLSLLNDVFTVRAGMLLGQWPGEEVAGRLSGCLIGHEIRAGLGLAKQDASVILVGSAELCQRYQQALALFGVESRMPGAIATVEGFRRLARETER